jgi:protein-tyrosine-phosphatase
MSAAIVIARYRPGESVIGPDATDALGARTPRADHHSIDMLVSCDSRFGHPREFPKPWTDEVVQPADVVITMGCGDACPLYPGTRYEDWELDDPHGLDIADVRRIRDEIRTRVETLLGVLNAPY